MTPDDPLFKQLLETFGPELESLLAIITDHLNKIERAEKVDDRLLMMAEISRAGRNIKVSAFSVGLDSLGTIAELIEKLYESDQPISMDLIHLTARAVDEMHGAIHDFIDKKPSSIEFNELVNQLKSYLYPQEQERQQIEGTSAPPPMEQSTSRKLQLENELRSDLTKETMATLDHEFKNKPAATFKIELQDNLISITDGLLQLEKGGMSEEEFQSLLKEMFRVAHNIKGSARGIGAIEVGDMAHHLEALFAVIQQKKVNSSAQIINLCLQSIDFMNEAMQCFSEQRPLSFDLQNHLQQLSDAVGGTGFEEGVMHHAQEAPRSTELQEKRQVIMGSQSEFDSIRVSLHNLDRISVYLEEIQALKISIEEHYAKLAKINFKLDYLTQSTRQRVTFKTNDSAGSVNASGSVTEVTVRELNDINQETHLIERELRIPISELSHLLNGLQDEVRTLRLIPVTNQLRYLPRIVRDVAQKLKKEVNFEIKSNEFKIDKLILDGLKDPLVHILRNAIDHGIENPEVRLAAGKSQQGNITIEVTQHNNYLVFKIVDDGMGIELDKVIRIALKKNMITQTELHSMKQENIYDLIFHPGFSTRQMATEISGRGIGLDVVRANLLRLKGQVMVESQPGKGTIFSLQVPLTLATERGLIISCSGQEFVIILSAVECVLLLKQQDIVHVEGSPSVLVKEQPVLLCSLATILHVHESEIKPKEHFSVVVIKREAERIALLVDQIIGEREIVLKPLQEPLSNIPCVIGATLTGSNQINFVLSASEIIKKMVY